jgi:alpha-1,4-fucosyltransferase
VLIFLALQAGTVPVYLGAPNIEEFDPLYELNADGSKPKDWKPRSLIRASDFSGPEELANYLKYVASNETLYNSFLEWKSKPPTKRFTNLSSMSLDFADTACRICKNVSILKQKAQRAVA